MSASDNTKNINNNILYNNYYNIIFQNIKYFDK